MNSICKAYRKHIHPIVWEKFEDGLITGIAVLNAIFDIIDRKE